MDNKIDVDKLIYLLGQENAPTNVPEMKVVPGYIFQNDI